MSELVFNNFKSIYENILKYIFYISDNIGFYIFDNFDCDWIIEIGVHKGEIARKYHHKKLFRI